MWAGVLLDLARIAGVDLDMTYMRESTEAPQKRATAGYSRSWREGESMLEYSWDQISRKARFPRLKAHREGFRQWGGRKSMSISDPDLFGWDYQTEPRSDSDLELFRSKAMRRMEKHPPRLQGDVLELPRFDLDQRPCE
jgi:hypothetical protein